MAEPRFSNPGDRPDRNPLNSEVWQCPQCTTQNELVQIPDGVLLRCGTCGFTERGKPAPNFDVE